MEKKYLLVLLLALFINVSNAQIITSKTKIYTIENAIKTAEQNLESLKPDNDARIIWAKDFKEKQSAIAFVYLHGFGASNREGQPIMSMLSKAYNANVYLSRLKEHGLSRDDNFKNLTPENYIASAKEALEIGKLIGKKVILVSTSTGGTLSLKLASEDPSIAGLIMYSPFIDLKNPSFASILTPKGKAAIIKMNGGEITKQSRPEEEQKYWSNSYHIDGYEALIKMLKSTMTVQTFEKIKIPVFVGYYYKNEKEQDETVSVPAILKMFESLGTALDQKTKIAFPDAGNHVIACDLRSNDWKNVYNQSTSFIDAIILKEQRKFDFELQGHRGARGLAPENTIPAFKKALDIGVNTLEIDVVISRDNQVVVSHEPWLNYQITSDAKGSAITKEAALAFNIYKNKYKTVKKYDVGAFGNPKFPEQEKLKTYKPLLAEVIKYAETINPAILYNIEIKSTPVEEANGYQPSVKEFSDLLISELKKSNLPLNRITIQSFDPRVLEYFHKIYPNYQLSFLTFENNFDTNMKALSFIPSIYSPYHVLLNDTEVEKIHQKNMKVIPWTVNNKEDMIRLLTMNVDGIITDYPNIAIPLRK
jgi:glycerophosphoryl diester phosphodiesterase/pimeloyl-ACP methyl ester carboxylesterase